MTGRILTAIDPNHPDPRIVEAAAVLARATGTGLLLVAVTSPPPIEPTVPLIVDAEALDAAEAELEGVSLAAGDLQVEMRTVQSASPTRAIHDIARKEFAQAIVAGTGRHRRFGRVGSVASRLLHDSPCPVMIVPPRLFDAGRSIRRIGVAYVPTDDGLAALHTATSLARSLGGPLQVISVARPVAWTDASMAPGYTFTGQEIGEAHADELAQMRTRTYRAAADCGGGVEITTLVEEGDPAAVLANLSHELDLLVCGTRGHGPVVGLVLGTVSRRLVHEASCPVLVIPPDHDPVAEEPINRLGALI